MTQVDAIENVVSGFKTAERGQLIMACGTGKTLVSLWVKERFDAKRTLVLVPSLGLLSQILNDWTRAARLPFDALCVCSDQTAGRREESEDDAIRLVSDLAFPVTNSSAEIAKREIAEFLKSDGHLVIFSTYHSSPLIAEAQQNTTVPNFDLIVADEAHRCAGKVASPFATVLDGTKLRKNGSVKTINRERLFGASMSLATCRPYRDETNLSVSKRLVRMRSDFSRTHVVFQKAWTFPHSTAWLSSMREEAKSTLFRRSGEQFG
jgi:predicted helicase